MRAPGITRFGDPVRLLELDGPRRPYAGEVLIEVKAAGVGNWDEFVRCGRWDVGQAPPLTLGVEAAGIVSELGVDTEGWSVGDEVLTHPLPLADQGTWASRLVARADRLARKPPNVSWSHAGAFPVPALTAVQVLDDALGLRPGQTLLVNGAASVTGGLIATLAAVRGVEVLGTAGPSSRDRVLSAGATGVADYHDPRLAAADPRNVRRSRRRCGGQRGSCRSSEHPTRGARRRQACDHHLGPPAPRTRNPRRFGLCTA